MRRNRCLYRHRQLQLAGVIWLFLLANAWVAMAGDITGVVTDKANGKPIKDAVVFILHVPDREFQPPAEVAIMDQINRKFIPYVLTILVGTTVTFPNKDQIPHHVSSTSRAKRFQRPLYKGTSIKPVEFDKIGVVKLRCEIHPEMLAVIVALQNPFFATTDRNGNYTIENVPAGTYKLAVWHEFLNQRLAQTAKVIDTTNSKKLTVDHAIRLGSVKRRKGRPGDYRER